MPSPSRRGAALTAAGLAAAVLLAAAADGRVERATPDELRIPAGKTALYARVVGHGRPVIVVHGGPDFDHSYLRDLDTLADVLRLVYYDQRGRGRSADNVRPEDVTLGSELDDLDRVRVHMGFDAPVLLGHSWGAVLALEYALRYPARVSHLVLMNPAPASAGDAARTREAYLDELGADMERQREIVSGGPYRDGDPAAVAARYAIHFKPAFTRTEHHARLMGIMKSAFLRQGAEGILKARAIEDRLMSETWRVPSYDLLPRLRKLRIPALVIAGADDFIPVAIAARLAEAIPGGRQVTLEDCGHFAYLECADGVRTALADFLRAR